MAKAKKKKKKRPSQSRAAKRRREERARRPAITGIGWPEEPARIDPKEEKTCRDISAQYGLSLDSLRSIRKLYGAGE